MANDKPELLLVAVLIVSAKLFFPFENIHGPYAKLPEFDWREWRRIMMSDRSQTASNVAPEEDHTKFTVEQLISMSAEDLDNYLRMAADSITNKGQSLREETPPPPKFLMRYLTSAFIRQ
jgi:hypothetical protein